MDLVERAGQLKPMLVEFALSPRFDRELSAVIARNFPGGVVTDESVFSMVLDHFALQHQLRSGNTVVEAFAAAHPELTGAERDMLLGWRDVVESFFEVTGKDRDALVLVNFLDELTYRARSNLGWRPPPSMRYATPKRSSAIPPNSPRPAASLTSITRRSWTCSAPTSSSSPVSKCPARGRSSTTTWPTRR